MLLMIDNYDSFTFNLVQYLQALGAEVAVVRNDALSVDDIERAAPERIVISPGPCTPDQAGVSLEVVRRLGSRIPILGVCLGHQRLQVLDEVEGEAVVVVDHQQHAAASRREAGAAAARPTRRPKPGSRPAGWGPAPTRCAP